MGGLSLKSPKACVLWPLGHGIITTNKDTFMSLASSQMSFDSCQKELRKMRLYLPGNCLIFITLNADPLRRQGQGAPPRGLRWRQEEDRTRILALALPFTCP